MKDSKFGGEIRGQMVRFSGEVSLGMCKPARRFVGEAIHGIQARQSELRSRRSCWFVVQAYLRRWQIEETIRCMKQSYGIENVRLLTYGRLRNMMVLVLCAMYFAAVCIGEGVRLGVLAHYALEEAQRFYGIPNFRYYALAVGLGKLLRGSTRPFAESKEPLFQEMQLSLFGP